MEELELYHISCIEYKNGETAPLQNVNSYHLLTVQQGIGWVNDFLDIKRPTGAPSRIRSYYACDTIRNCIGYGRNKQCENGGPFLYKVAMKNPRKVPMSLVNTILRKREGNALNDQIADEYWTPTREWKYYEYLSEEMKIIERLEILQEYYQNNASMLIGLDQDLAKTIFS